MFEAAIKNELAHLYSLWSTSPLSRWLLANILWYYIYKCMGMALPGILGTLQFEGHGHADFEQNGFQHSTWSSAGNQSHSWLSTKIKSPSTGIISVKQPFCSIAIRDKSALILALAKACNLMRATSGLVHQCAEVKVHNSYACEEMGSPMLPFSQSSQRLQSSSLSAAVHTQTCTHR